MTTTVKSTGKGRIYFILLALVFIGPIVASYLLYNFRAFVPETISNGHLILPPLSLEKLPLQNASGAPVVNSSLKKDWVLLYIEPKQCNKSCIDTLYKMRQIRIRLGKNSDRVQRVILTFTGLHDPVLKEYLASLYQGTLHWQTPEADLSKFLEKLPSHNIAIQSGYLYLVDPLGNVMMSYNPDQNPKDIYNDLTRLLKASQIG